MTIKTILERTAQPPAARATALSAAASLNIPARTKKKHVPLNGAHAPAATTCRSAGAVSRVTAEATMPSTPHHYATLAFRHPRGGAPRFPFAGVAARIRACLPQGRWRGRASAPSRPARHRAGRVRAWR
jgi:hypothetical protein